MFKELIDKIKPIKTHQQLNDDIVEQLIGEAVSASINLSLIQHEQFETRDAIMMARIKVLELFDSIIIQDILDTVDNDSK